MNTIPKPRLSGLKLYGSAAVLIAVAVVTFGIMHRASAKLESLTVAKEASIPTVAVVKPILNGDVEKMVLPGALEPLNRAAIFAQTTGYIKEWSADIGDLVKAGQILATLEVPELAHQLAQAQATYKAVLGEQKLAESNATRINTLASVNAGAVSRQAVEQANSEALTKAATASAALANVKRLEATQEFTKLVAPFDGVVTSRSAQIGNLVVAGAAGSSPLFTVSDVQRLRVYVRVSQNYTLQMRSGLKAGLSVPELPGRTFEVVVTRTAGAIDPQSGSLLVELQADNKNGELMPGAYAQVAFDLKRSSESISIPGSALLYRDDGPVVAVLDADNRVSLKPVTIGRDGGKVVEIISGLSANERLADNPSDAIRTGDTVRVQQINTALDTR